MKSDFFSPIDVTFIMCLETVQNIQVRGIFQGIYYAPAVHFLKKGDQ